MPKKWIKIRQHKNKWVTAGIRVSGDRLRSLSKLRKEGIMSEELQKYYCQYKKIYNNVLCEAKKLNNNMQIRSSGNKSKAMWELVKEELSEQRKTPKNIQLKIDGTTIQNPTDIANVLNEYYTNIARQILNGNTSSKTMKIGLTQ
jgi:hypothetical protein